MSAHPSILIVAGEESGERLAAELVASMASMRPGLTFWGVGGDMMRVNGVDLVATTELTAVSGFLEIARHYRALRRLMREIKTRAARERPSLALLVDYPGFNLRLARLLCRTGIPVVYYVAPQTWAWKEGRMKELRRHVSTLIVVFPFEETYFRRHGVAVRYFGNPHANRIRHSNAQSLIGPSEVDTRPVIAYLPGSRRHEVERHLPLVIDVANRLGPSFRHVVARARNIDVSLLSECLQASDVTIADGSDEALRIAHVAVVKAGTSTLDATMYGVPFVTIYRTSWPSYLVSRMLIRIPWVAMPNILMHRRIVPELIQNDCTAERVASVVRDIADEGSTRSTMIEDLRDLRTQLSGHDPVGDAARFIVESYLDPNETD